MKIKIYALSLLSVFNAYVATAVDYYYKASVGTLTTAIHGI